MLPFAPQIDRNATVFAADPFARWNGEVVEFKQPDWVVKYAGDTADLPTLSRGILSLLPIYGDVNPHKVPFSDLIQVNVAQGSAVLTKMKTRIECRKHICQANEYYGTIITQRNAGKIPYVRREYVNYDPEDAQHPECEADCEARAKWVAEKINSDPYKLGTAVVITEVADGKTSYQVEYESLLPGAVFDQSVEGFTQPDIIVPPSRISYTAGIYRSWYGSKFLDAAIPDNKTYSVAEVLHWEKIQTDNYAGSSNASPYGVYIWRMSLGHVLFDEADAESLAALTELKSIVNFEKSPALYFSKLFSTASAPVVVYPYTIQRTDAGDAAAFTAASTAYAGANRVSFKRAAIVDGKSYYEYGSKSASQPAAVGGDAVEPGSYGPDNGPCLDCE